MPAALRMSASSSGGMSAGTSMDAAASAPYQMPDKSGLPSRVRGAGAFRLTAPLLVRGALFCGGSAHCAAAGSVTSPPPTMPIAIKAAAGILR